MENEIFQRPAKGDMKMRKRLALWMAVVMAVFTFPLFSADSGQQPRKPTWTILVYGNGDNSLSYQMVADLRKMESTGSGPGFNIVVQADFDASAEEENEDAGLPHNLNRGASRFLVAKSTNPDRVTSRPVQRLPELNHDDPRVLSEFIRWALKKYPADRFGIVFWDHGNQWEGYGGDEQDGTVEKPRGMSTAAIRSAMLEAMKSAGIGKWGFVAFDACLMGGIEVLADFADLADIFIACPEIDTGEGWNYGPVLQWLKNRPEASMSEFGRMEAALWQELHLTKENEADHVIAAHSVYDLAAYPSVRAAFSSFAAALSHAYTPANLAIPRQRRLSIEYGLEDIKSIGEATDYIDLGTFAEHLAADSKSPEPLRKAAKDLSRAIEKMVLARVLGSGKKGAAGLSAWYPVDDEWEDGSKLPAYEQISFSRQTPWPRFLQGVLDTRRQQKDPPELEDPETPYLTVQAGQPLRVALKVTHGPGAFFIHGALVDNKLGRRNDFVYLGEVISREIEGTGRYALAWDARILTLSGEKGKHVYLGAFPKDAVSNLWISYADYQARPRAKKRRVILLTRIKAGTARVLSMLDGAYDNAAPAPVKVRPGGKITPIYHVETRKGDDPDKWKSGFIESKATVTIPGGGLPELVVAAGPLPPGSYNLEIKVEDVYGYMSDAINYELTVK
jgi:hypothetical protein